LRLGLDRQVIVDRGGEPLAGIVSTMIGYVVPRLDLAAVVEESRRLGPAGEVDHLAPDSVVGSWISHIHVRTSPSLSQ
jgi:hypothetical protein